MSDIYNSHFDGTVLTLHEKARSDFRYICILESVLGKTDMEAAIEKVLERSIAYKKSKNAFDSYFDFLRPEIQWLYEHENDDFSVLIEEFRITKGDNK